MPFTRIGTDLFEWPPWLAMTPLARCLWLGLYASPQAHLFLPGLFRGGMAVMSESACLGVTDAQTALRELLDRRLAVHDERHRMILFTQLPDRGCRPANGKHLRSLWNRWRDLPDCDVVSAWVWLLHWLCQPFTGDHQKVWDATFGTVTDVRSSTKPVCTGDYISICAEDYDAPGVVRLSTKGHDEPPFADVHPESTQTAMFPQESDTVSDTVCHTHVCTVLCSSGKKGGSGGKPKGPANGEHPFDVKALLTTLGTASGGRVATEPWDVRMAKPLWAVIKACGEAQVTLDDVRIAGEWLAAGGLGYRDDLGIPWVAKTGELLNAVAKARAWEGAGRGPVESRKQGGRGGVTARDLARRAAALAAQGE